MPMIKMPTFMLMKHNQCNVLAMNFIRKYQFTLINIHALIKSEIIVYELIAQFAEPRNNAVDLSDVGDAGSLPLTARNSKPNATQSDPSFPKPSLFFNLVTESYANPCTL